MPLPSAPLFQPDRFAHANLFVRDVEESVAFYRDVCGITEVFREPGVKAGFLSNGATHHDVGLMQVSGQPLIGKDGTVQNSMERGRVPGLNHIAFHVGSEASLVDAFEQAAARGVALEKALDHGMSRSLYLFDPDRNAVEFYIDTVADWRGFYAENQGNLISAMWRPARKDILPGFDAPARQQTVVEEAPLHTTEICGATLIASDLAASCDFYCRVGGLQVHQASAEAVLLALPGQHHASMALVQAREGDRVGLHSLWFLIAEGSDALHAPAQGITRSAPKRCHALDPNGIGLALYAGMDAMPAQATRADTLLSEAPADARALS